MDTMKADSAPLYDSIYHFSGIGGRESFCHLLIKRVEDTCLVTFTELDSNIGTSVTNWEARLATEVAAKFRLDIHRTEWFGKQTRQIAQTTPLRGFGHFWSIDSSDKINYTWKQEKGQWMACNPECSFMARA